MIGRLFPYFVLLAFLSCSTTAKRVTGNHNVIARSRFSSDSTQKTAFYNELTARIVPDSWCSECSESAQEVCDCDSGTLKTLRAVDKFHVTDTEMIEALANDGEYSGPLSAWAAFADLEISKILCSDSKKKQFRQLTFEAYEQLVGQKEALKAECHVKPDSKLNMMVVFELPHSTADYASGWRPNKPGFVFWVRVGALGPSMLFGNDVMNLAGQQVAAAVHMYTHQYAVSKSKLDAVRDYVTHHAGILVEWQDKPGYSTVYELAYRNGLGGYKGQSNYYPAEAFDEWISHETLDKLFRESGGLHQPWIDTLSEARILDIDHAPNMQAFVRWMRSSPKFRHPRIVFSAPSAFTRFDIHKAVWNSLMNDGVYKEAWPNARNCQTWAADLFTHLTGYDASVKGHNWPTDLILGSCVNYQNNMSQFQDPQGYNQSELVVLQEFADLR